MPARTPPMRRARRDDSNAYIICPIWSPNAKVTAVASSSTPGLVGWPPSHVGWLHSEGAGRPGHQLGLPEDEWQPKRGVLEDNPTLGSYGRLLIS